MKKINNKLSIIALLLGGFIFTSCKDEVKQSELDYPNDITFNEGEGMSLKVPYLNFIVPETPYKVSAFNYGQVTLNVKKNTDGTHTGFALSNKNYRSYPWCNSKPLGGTPSAATLKEAVDTSIFSVFTGSYANQLKNYTVVRVSGDDAFFTIENPSVVEHVLVANTTYNYLLMTYGSRYSSKLNSTTQVYDEYNGAKLATIRNPNIPDPVTSKYGVWYLPDIYGFGGGKDYVRFNGQQVLQKLSAAKIAANSAREAGKTQVEIKADSTAAYTSTVKGYFKAIAKGYLNGKLTGTSEYYLAAFTGVAPAPYDKWNIIQPGWAKWDLSSLGTVNKVVFYLDSSDKDENGKMRTPPYFCLDGIRIK